MASAAAEPKRSDIDPGSGVPFGSVFPIANRVASFMAYTSPFGPIIVGV
jgi:hypothetical protein